MEQDSAPPVCVSCATDVWPTLPYVWAWGQCANLQLACSSRPLCAWHLTPHHREWNASFGFVHGTASNTHESRVRPRGWRPVCSGPVWKQPVTLFTWSLNHIGLMCGEEDHGFLTVPIPTAWSLNTESWWWEQGKSLQPFSLTQSQPEKWFENC